MGAAESLRPVPGSRKVEQSGSGFEEGGGSSGRLVGRTTGDDQKVPWTLAYQCPVRAE